MALFTEVGATGSVNEEPEISCCLRREVQPRRGGVPRAPRDPGREALVTAAWLDIRHEKRC
jgi:hypothetical protein